MLINITLWIFFFSSRRRHTRWNCDWSSDVCSSDLRGAELGLAPLAQAKNREVLDAGRAAIALAREAGVRIGFGTDLMGALDGEQLHGLRLQAEVEGPLALLRAATSVNAELLGRDDLGRIGPGAVADLLVLDADPLQDPSVLWGGPDRRAVFQAGIRVAEHDARLVL